MEKHCEPLAQAIIELAESIRILAVGLREGAGSGKREAAVREAMRSTETALELVDPTMPRPSAPDPAQIALIADAEARDPDTVGESAS